MRDAFGGRLPKAPICNSYCRANQMSRCGVLPSDLFSGGGGLRLPRFPTAQNAESGLHHDCEHYRVPLLALSDRVSKLRDGDFASKSEIHAAACGVIEGGIDEEVQGVAFGESVMQDSGNGILHVRPEPVSHCRRV